MERAIGKRIRELRESVKMDAKTLAAAAGVSASAISQIESGATKSPRVTTLLKIARRMGLTMEQLVDVTLPLPSVRERAAHYAVHLSPAALEIGQWFDSLSTENQRKFVGVLLAYGPAVPNERVARFFPPAPNAKTERDR